jgi:hypothetical protein
MTRSATSPFRALSRTVGLLLALAALAAVLAPAASAHGRAPAPIRTSETFELNIYDSHLSIQCDQEVVATLSGTERRTIYLGRTPTSPATELNTFDGRITWQAPATGKSYSDRMASVLHISYPQGIDLFNPARITVLGQHGGTFPIGGGPAGTGVLVYDATIYSLADDGSPYWSVDGDPVAQHGNFAQTAKRICARLA